MVTQKTFCFAEMANNNKKKNSTYMVPRQFNRMKSIRSMIFKSAKNIVRDQIMADILGIHICTIILFSAKCLGVKEATRIYI